MSLKKMVQTGFDLISCSIISLRNNWRHLSVHISDPQHESINFCLFFLQSAYFIMNISRSMSFCLQISKSRNYRSKIQISIGTENLNRYRMHPILWSLKSLAMCKQIEVLQTYSSMNSNLFIKQSILKNLQLVFYIQ